MRELTPAQCANTGHTGLKLNIVDFIFLLFLTPKNKSKMSRQAKNKKAKRKAREYVYARFANALAEFEKAIKPKKFKAKLKKASKLFAEDIAKITVKQEVSIRKKKKKTTKSKPSSGHAISKKEILS